MVDKIDEGTQAAPPAKSAEEEALALLMDGSETGDDDGGDAPAQPEPQAPETPEGGEPQAPADAAPDTPAQAEEDEDSRTQLWARLTQQDKELRELRRREKNSTSLEKLREVARRNPAKVLADLGMGIDQVIDALAQAGHPASGEREKPEQAPPEIEEVRRELAQIKEERRREREEAAAQAEIMRIDEAIRSNPDRWEVIHAQRNEGSYKLVLDTARDLIERLDEIPPAELVLDAVEEYLAGEARKRLARLSGLKKFRQAAPPQPSGAPAAKPKQGRAAPVVDGNAPTSTPGKPSAEEMERRALELLLSGTEE
jgi:hypothetical protein